MNFLNHLLHNFYFMVFVLYLLGFGFWILSKTGALQQKYPTLSAGQIWGTFLKEEWNSILVSVLVLLVYLTINFIIKDDKLIVESWYSTGTIYFLSLVLGYSGMRQAYKILGTAENALDKKVNQIGSMVDNVDLGAKKV